ncbi:hypothetical protein CPT_Percy2 [Caulobacter phage Percy]|uniref:Uncharacterized protein n=1 Tax=Caulobacter phage Percy TaxID=1701809 RepID=A0A0M5M188_9CAUD|nr:hypothetical protein CPT_Percy2 [Caulobacter phage Percy]ALF01636.1 hypothetical protein CPT_Percy2 [Caulobacter phage Percy]
MSDYDIMNLLDLAMGVLLIIVVGILVYCLNNPCDPRRRRRK